MKTYGVYSNGAFLTSRLTPSKANNEARRRRRLGFQNVEVRPVEWDAVKQEANAAFAEETAAEMGTSAAAISRIFGF
jgi:hypothetical protein